jgi:hypothetical protein
MKIKKSNRISEEKFQVHEKKVREERKEKDKKKKK